jgi:uncharacterized membrane protein YhaH (DUF805 family)
MEEVKKYLDFTGRSTRSEYWGVNIVSYLGLILTAILSVLIIMSGILGALFGGIFILVSVFILTWVILAVTARRCRDAGINPWFAGSILIPYIAVIPWVVFGCLPTERENAVE